MRGPGPSHLLGSLFSPQYEPRAKQGLLQSISLTPPSYARRQTHCQRHFADRETEAPGGNLPKVIQQDRVQSWNLHPGLSASNVQLPPFSIAASTWSVPGPDPNRRKGGCVQLEVLSQEAEVCPSSVVWSALCGLGQGSQDEGWGSRGDPGGWSFLSQQPEASKIGGSLPAWPF